MLESLRAMEQKEQDYFDYFLNQVEISNEKVAVSDGARIDIVIYKPRSLGLMYGAAYIYAHGGGAFAFEAKDFNNMMAVTCVNLECIVVSVNFRKGPEVKCPRGQLDYADVVYHIMKNPTRYRIDTNRVCMAGISGGGWIVTGAANIMAK